MSKLAWLLGCIVLSAVVIWRTVPTRSNLVQRALLVGAAALPAGALLYYFGAIASTFFRGA